MKKKVIPILLLIFTFVIYLITSSGSTPYDYFVRLADSFLKGRYYLIDNPGWLNELIPLDGNKYAVVYPPGPALILMPFVYFFGDKFPQQMMAHLLGAGLAVITAQIAFLKSKKNSHFVWFFLLAAFGNILWFLSSNGSVWYLGQVAGAFFLTATIFESLKNKRPLFVSVFFGMAILSRLQTILTLPLIIFLNKNNLSKKNILFYLIPLGILMILYGYYNEVRFDSFFQTGYSLIPGVLDEPWYSKGIFHLSYIKNNLRVMFTSLPIFKSEFPYITPSWGGLSILITTPAFIYLLLAKLKEKENLFAWISLLLVALVTFSHGGTGFTQFGYRYAVDFYPIIFLLLANSLKGKNLKWHHWLLLIICIIVNLWGVLWINKFGWVSF